jgi:hypothetical protein
MFGNANVLMMITYGPREVPVTDARKYGTTNPVLIEARINHDPYDEFAWVQDWRFAICDLLLWNLGVPTDGFDPGCAEGPEETFAYDTLSSVEASYDELRYALKVLDRYREWLRIAGKDY